MSKVFFSLGLILTLCQLVMPLPGCTDDIPDKTEYGTKDYYKDNRGACAIPHPIRALAMQGIKIFHERCVCRGKAVKECKEACDEDDKCRGFVETSSKLPGGMADGCQYATTSTECAPGCEKLESDGMMTGAGKLWPGENGFSGYCGCWIKKSMIR